MIQGWICPLSPKAEMPHGVSDGSHPAGRCLPSGCCGEVTVGAG